MPQLSRTGTELKRFGQKLRVLRTRHGMTTKVMAETLSLKSHSYMSELETGKKEPTALFVLKVARFFNVSADALMKDELDIDNPDGEHDPQIHS